MTSQREDPLTPPPASRNPDTIFVSALLLAAGVGLILSGVEPGSVNALVPGWMATTWAVILTTGAGTTLAGVLWPGHVTGLLIEAAGRVMLAPASLAYAVAVVATAGVSGGTVAGLLVALALSSGWRLGQIVRQVRYVRRTLGTIAARRETL